jgi:hypothetical protein
MLASCLHNASKWRPQTPAAVAMSTQKLSATGVTPDHDDSCSIRSYLFAEHVSGVVVALNVVAPSTNNPDEVTSELLPNRGACRSFRDVDHDPFVAIDHATRCRVGADHGPI